MGIKFSNNASANITQALTSTATSVSVTVGKGDLFPSLTEGDYFYATLAGNSGLEIVKVTNRVNDTMTIVRAQDNTTALSFDTGDLFELRIVAADFNDTFENTISIVNSAASSKAPILHASSSTEYGSGSSEQYGHLKSHDAPNATFTAATGHAFSPAGAAAMQEALEEGIEEAKRNAESAHFTATIDGLDLVLSFEDGTEKRVKLPSGKSVGDLWIGFDPASKPANVQVYGGQLLSRSAYEAHSSMVLSGERTVLTDTEWQEHVASNGFCPFYSSGDGSTTYRMPLIKGVHPEFVAALAEAGSFVQAGLPNITGTLEGYGDRTGFGVLDGAFYRQVEQQRIPTVGDIVSGHSSALVAGFDASRSNPIYGRSDNVQPPSVTCVLGEYVFGAVAALGEAEVEELIERIDKLETRAPGVPLGTLLPYTGEDVPAGTLRADGTVYNMKAAFPDFYEWVVASGLTVPLADYALVEGSCGYYGLDTSTGTVRMPTLAAGVFGTVAAGQYGVAVAAGLPNITGGVEARPFPDAYVGNGGIYNAYGAFTLGSKASNISVTGVAVTDVASNCDVAYFDASRSSAIYGRSDTVTPAHVKYPWVIVVYNAAVPPSVAQAGEFVELMDEKVDKTNPKDSEGRNIVRLINGNSAGEDGNVWLTTVPTGSVIAFAQGWIPDGFLHCNGAAISRSTYANLFAHVGTLFGAGDGSTTFNLPQLADGRYIRGASDSGTYLEPGLPNIRGVFSHSHTTYDQPTRIEGAFATITAAAQNMRTGDAGTTHRTTDFNAARSNGHYGRYEDVIPRSLHMVYGIKY